MIRDTKIINLSYNSRYNLFFPLSTFACNRDHSWRTSVKFSGFLTPSWPHFGQICSTKILQPPLLCLLMDILYEWSHKWITPYVNMSFLLILWIWFGAGCYFSQLMLNNEAGASRAWYQHFNIAINGHFRVEVANQEHPWFKTSTQKGPFTTMLISCSRGTYLIEG